MAETLIWVFTVPAVAVYGWAIWAWPKLPVRIAATALFMAFWLGTLQFVDMNIVWRIAMPAVVVLAMLSILIRRSGRQERPAPMR